MIVQANINKKYFKNLSMHMDDFGMKTQWIFFTISHNKSPCDGIEDIKKSHTKSKSSETIRYAD